MRWMLALVSVGAIVLVGAACGGGEGDVSGMVGVGGSEEEQISQLNQEFFSYFQDGRWSKVYELYSQEFRDRCPPAEFLASFPMAKAIFGEEAWEDMLHSIELVTVENIRIEGDGATAEVTAEFLGERGTEIQRYVKENAEWRLMPDPGTTGCESDADDDEPTSLEESEAAPVGLGQIVSIDGSRLSKLMGEPEPEGQILVTFDEVETADRYVDVFDRVVYAKGTFVIVYYRVQNDLKSRMQPATQLNDDFVVKDARGRQWESADYTGDYFDVSGAFAEERGADEPAHWIGAGFTGKTAVAFDVPPDAEGLYLWSDDLDIKVLLSDE